MLTLLWIVCANDLDALPIPFATFKRGLHCVVVSPRILHSIGRYPLITDTPTAMGSRDPMGRSTPRTAHHGGVGMVTRVRPNPHLAVKARPQGDQHVRPQACASHGRLSELATG